MRFAEFCKSLWGCGMQLSSDSVWPCCVVVLSSSMVGCNHRTCRIVNQAHVPFILRLLTFSVPVKFVFYAMSLPHLTIHVRGFLSFVIVCFLQWMTVYTNYVAPNTPELSRIKNWKQKISMNLSLTVWMVFV